MTVYNKNVLESYLAQGGKLDAALYECGGRCVGTTTRDLAEFVLRALSNPGRTLVYKDHYKDAQGVLAWCADLRRRISDVLRGLRLRSEDYVLVISDGGIALTITPLPLVDITIQ